jgi:ABC-type anion transport system duplicated permease subunit
MNTNETEKRSWPTRIKRAIIRYGKTIRKHVHHPHFSLRLRTRGVKVTYPHWAYGFAILVFILLIVLVTVIAIPFKAIPTLTYVIQRMVAYPYVPFYALQSIIRLAISYFLSLCIALALGILATEHKRLGNILIPFFDVMQSVPALAFFPIIFIICIHIFGFYQSPVNGATAYTGPGVEIASILLLMTGMLWYQLFNVIGSILAIPRDIHEVSHLFNLRGWKRFQHVILPAIFPGIVTGGIQSWGGGWNASIVSEYVTYGNNIYWVQGLGFFLSYAAWMLGDTTLVILGIITMSAIILILNRFVWHRLFETMEKYSFG